jgi:hypothetical protein
MKNWSEKRYFLTSDQLLPQGIISIIVYLLLFRLISTYILCYSIPHKRVKEPMLLREPVVWLFVTNIMFLIYLVVNVIVFPWRKTCNKCAPVIAYTVAGGLLLLVQYVLAVMLWPELFLQ